MISAETESIKKQLLDRKNKLQHSIRTVKNDNNLLELLNEVDSALERIESKTYGFCEVCHDPIEDFRLKEDPLLRFCLDHLTTKQQRALEQDLKLASKIQNALLPKNTASVDGWEYSYHYEPAEIVSGDYCDVVIMNQNSKDNLFILGDVSGKGVSASMLMSHLHAMFHSLSSINLGVSELVERANRLFCESTLSTHYSTLAAVLVHNSGDVEVCNAGHCPPLLLTKSGVIKVESTGVPIGLFCSSKFGVNKYKLESGDSIILYSDGLSEAQNYKEEFGENRILSIANSFTNSNPQKIIAAYLDELKSFLSGSLKSDDLTLLVIRKQ
ncbi:MAG: SpoIIE family protein phosphatase [Ignavibacteriaceae bacterium]|nr:SpoIIE family protein phosphatase [Ignavibacteriaceae bacterium]